MLRGQSATPNHSCTSVCASTLKVKAVLCCCAFETLFSMTPLALAHQAVSQRGAAHQGLTLVHFSPQRNHVLWDAVGTGADTSPLFGSA